MPPPDTLTVAAVSQDGKQVQLVGQGDTGFDVVDKDKVLPPLAAGLTFQGWANLQGEYGPYISVAKKQNGSQPAPQAPQQGFTPQAAPAPMAPVQAPQPPQARDPKDVSIERQVAAYCTTALIGQEGFTGIPDDQFEGVFRRTLNSIHAAIQGDESVPF